MKQLRLIILAFFSVTCVLLTSTIFKQAIASGWGTIVNATSPAYYWPGISKAIGAHSPNQRIQENLVNNDPLKDFSSTQFPETVFIAQQNYCGTNFVSKVFYRKAYDQTIHHVYYDFNQIMLVYLSSSKQEDVNLKFVIL